MESQGDSKYRREVYDKRYQDPERLMFVFGAREWIAEHRVALDTGRLDITGTAERLAVDTEYFKYRDLRVYGQACYPENRIRLIVDTNSANQIETFGHEVGHFFQHYHMGHDEFPILDYRREDERFCDVFAEEMALPLEQLQHIEDVTSKTVEKLMDDYDTGLELTVHQLARVKKLPRKVLILAAKDYAPNPAYSHKEIVVPICLDCSTSDKATYGVCEPPNPDTLVLDFRHIIGVDNYITFCGGTKRQIVDYGLPLMSNKLGSALPDEIIDKTTLYKQRGL